MSTESADTAQLRKIISSAVVRIVTLEEKVEAINSKGPSRRVAAMLRRFGFRPRLTLRRTCPHCVPAQRGLLS